MYDLIIVGGGPAGITAAIYAARKKIKFAIIYKEIGGEVAKTTYIENYTGYESISGPELAEKFHNHMKNFNVEHFEDQVLSVEKKDKYFIIKTYEHIFETKTILMASGALPKALNIYGEKEFAGRGVSWCATCDGPLFNNKVVAIIGAGNTGLTSAISLMGIAKKVYIINKNPIPKADPVLVDKALENSKVELLNNALTQSINGSKLVESITVKIGDELKTIPVDGVFINIGYTPNSEPVKELVKLTNTGDIICDKNQETSIPGIFAAGDITDNPQKQIIIAAGEGAKAFLNIYDYLAKY